jgi:hypothetical protein
VLVCISCIRSFVFDSNNIVGKYQQALGLKVQLRGTWGTRGLTGRHRLGARELSLFREGFLTTLIDQSDQQPNRIMQMLFSVRSSALGLVI